MMAASSRYQAAMHQIGVRCLLAAERCGLHQWLAVLWQLSDGCQKLHGVHGSCVKTRGLENLPCVP